MCGQAFDGAPQVVEALPAHIHDTYLRWIDEPIPALDGLTPRHAIASATGRREVQQMIRTATVEIDDCSGTIGSRRPSFADTALTGKPDRTD